MTFFTEGSYFVTAPSIRLLLEPSHTSTLEDQALMGEKIEILERQDEFSLVKVLQSGKTGWISSPAQKLATISDHPSPTHRIRLPRAVTFRLPHAESETMLTLPLNSRVAISDLHEERGDTFVRVLGLSGSIDAWIRMSSLMEIDTWETDFVSVQERMLGTPYVWGARDTTLGVDCSSQLNLSLIACGQQFCPRDTKDQVLSSWLGEDMSFPPRAYGLRRGDLIFWKGHVATMKDEKNCYHATDLKPYHCSLEQPLEQVINERVFAGKGLPVKVKRFERYQRMRIQSLVA